jgi:hypothetical protein
MKHGVIVFVSGLLLASPVMAFDRNGALKGAMGKASGQSAGTSSTSGVDALSNADINAGLKEALTRGADDTNQASVEQYVTQQSLYRLYRLIGEKEQAIRANPMQAGSELLGKVFGAVK